MAWPYDHDVTSDELPVAEFGFPGPLRDRLVAAILSGAKTATTGLYAELERLGERPPRVGDRQAVVDSAGRRVGVIETTEVRVVPVREIDDAFARDEGEGMTTVGEWRRAHERFWTGEEMRRLFGGTSPMITDDTLVVAERFRLVARLGPRDADGETRSPDKS
jgi:uncharacterized protein YhfF